MAVQTNVGTKLFIGPAIVPGSEPEDVADYEALTYVEVGEISDFGEYGDSASDVTFASISDARMRHLRGVYDSGTLELTVGADRQDPGQNALEAALYDNRDFAFRVTYNDKLTDAGSGTSEYFSGKIMSARRQVGGVDTVITRAMSIGINTPILTDPAT